MAGIKQFSDIPTTGIPNAPVQQFAADESAATRQQGTNALLQGAMQAGATGLQAFDRYTTNKRVNELVGENADIPGMVEDPSQLTGEEASFLNFQQIANARQQGLSADRAKVAASTRLQQAIAKDPRRAEQYRSAFNNFFGGASGSTFDLTEMEQAREDMVDYGLSKFGIDKRLAQTNPQAWERKFQANVTLLEQQENAERVLKLAESGQKLDRIEQTSTFPQLVSSFLTNPESSVYVPSVVDSVLLQFRNEGGGFDANNAVAAEQQLNVQLTAIESQLRAQYSALSSGDFESMFQPVQDYFNNAIAVANGDMEEAALIRENRIFKESATQSLYQGDPEAASLWVGMTSIIGDLETVPPSLRVAQERLSKKLLSSMPSIVNPDSPVTAGDNLRSEGDVEDFNGFIKETLGGTMKASVGDERERSRASDNVTMVAKEISANPRNLDPGSYISYFVTTGDDFVLENLSEEQMAAVRESYGSESMQTFLNDTLSEWQRRSQERGGVSLRYNPDTQGIMAVVDEDAEYPATSKRHANRLNADMKRTNLFFPAANKVLGVSGEDILADNEIGQGILAVSGIEISNEVPEITFQEIPNQSGIQNLRLQALSERIVDGTADQRDLEELRALASDPTKRLREQNIPVLQQALDIAENPQQSGGTAQDTQPVTQPRTDAELTQRVQEIDVGGRNAPSQVNDIPEEVVGTRVEDLLINLAELEGGFQNNPRDSGNFVGDQNIGTNRGITPATLAAWRDVDPSSITEEDIKDITQREANEIYLSEYYEKPGIDRLEEGMQELMLNMAVLSGPRQAIRLLQEVSDSSVDGVIGPETVEASRSISPEDLADRYRDFLRSLEIYDEFGTGWESRIDKIVGGSNG